MSEGGIKISFSDGLALAGTIVAILLLVLDKAGKLKPGPMLFLLLAIAFLMTLPLAIGNAWVADEALGTITKFTRGLFFVCLSATGFSLIAVWIGTPERTLVNVKSAPVADAPTPSPPKVRPTPPVTVPTVGIHPKPPTFTETLGDFVVIAGGQQYRVSKLSTASSPSRINLFSTTQEKPEAVAYIENGRLLVNAQLYYASDKPPLELVHNELSNRPLLWDRNFNDSAIEIVDDRMRPRFQLIYHDPHTVLLRGIFQFDYRAVVVEERNKRFFVVVGGTIDSENLDPQMETGVLFQYPERLYHGQEVLGGGKQPQIQTTATDSAAIQGQLSKFIEEGIRLRDAWVPRLGKSEDIQQISATEIDQWHTRVEQYLKSIPRGNVYAVQFLVSASQPGFPSYPDGINLKLAGRWTALANDLAWLSKAIGDPALGKP
jgi:hypothetical protein